MGYKKAKMPPFMKDLGGFQQTETLAAQENIAQTQATAKKKAEEERKRIAAMHGRRFSQKTGPLGLLGPVNVQRKSLIGA